MSFDLVGLAYLWYIDFLYNFIMTYFWNNDLIQNNIWHIGPCSCPADKNFSPDCNKKTGQCRCKVRKDSTICTPNTWQQNSYLNDCVCCIFRNITMRRMAFAKTVCVMVRGQWAKIVILTLENVNVELAWLGQSTDLFIDRVWVEHIFIGHVKIFRCDSCLNSFAEVTTKGCEG